MLALAARTQVQGVVTQPDRPAGRGHKLAPTPVKTAALALGLPIFEPESLRAFAEEQRSRSIDLFALASYGRILPPALLAVPPLGALNVHPSLLPKYRGATPIQTALLNGETETGVSLMMMDVGMDTGPIVAQERTPIDASERYGELHDRLAILGAQMLDRALALAENGPLPSRDQSGEPSITKPLNKEDLRVAWEWPGRQIVNTVRAFGPAPAARAFLLGAPVKILRAQLQQKNDLHAEPGVIAGTRGDSLVVGCGDGAVEVLELIPPNRGAMPGARFSQ